MKHRLKGLLALVLSLVMVFALATNAWAVTATSVKIGSSVTLNSTNPYWKNGDTTATDSANDYNAYFDAATGILTLNDANISDTYYGSAITAEGGLTIYLIGDNTVTHNDSGGIAAIYVAGDLTIKEDRDDGSLTASDTGTNFDGILASGKVTIESGKVTATGGKYGLSASNVNIEGGTVTATGNKGRGIYTKEGYVTISDGTVEATGRDSGIYANSVTITDGTVNATGSGEYGYGIYALEDNFNGGDITISNGTVTATGGMAGMYADNKATIEGGTVTATGGSSGAGIGADNAITISGANTTVEVGCETGLVSDIVNIAGGSTVSIEAKNANNENAINTTTLNMTGDYQWSKDNTNFTDSNTSKLTKEIAIGTAKLYIKPLSGSGPATQQPPAYYPIYIPTVEDEPEVTAPNTFDGGIASAVVVTILSATGGAWLAKKKD